MKKTCHRPKMIATTIKQQLPLKNDSYHLDNGGYYSKMTDTIKKLQLPQKNDSYHLSNGSYRKKIAAIRKL